MNTDMVLARLGFTCFIYLQYVACQGIIKQFLDL